jgi:hypothetical protein
MPHATRARFPFTIGRTVPLAVRIRDIPATRSEPPCSRRRHCCLGCASHLATVDWSPGCRLARRHPWLHTPGCLAVSIIYTHTWCPISEAVWWAKSLRNCVWLVVVPATTAKHLALHPGGPGRRNKATDRVCSAVQYGHRAIA